MTGRRGQVSVINRGIQVGKEIVLNLEQVIRNSMETQLSRSGTIRLFS